MPRVHGAYDGENPAVENHTILAQTPPNETGAAGAMLMTDVECSVRPQISRIDSEPARVRVHTEVSGGELQYTDMAFDSLNLARLEYGLRDKYGPLDDPGENGVPVHVAVAGQDAVGAYLRIANGHPISRERVSRAMNVQPGTISNYCTRVRWDPDHEYKQDRVIEAVHSMEGEFTKSELKQTVGESDEIINTVLGDMNRFDIAEPVGDDDDRWRVVNSEGGR